jgi:hypothetical protein
VQAVIDFGVDRAGRRGKAWRRPRKQPMDRQ